MLEKNKNFYKDADVHVYGQCAYLLRLMTIFGKVISSCSQSNGTVSLLIERLVLKADNILMIFVTF